MAHSINEKKIDYSSFELKCGLELHQQLETGRKLFCKCKTELQQGTPQALIIRHMRPTLSELGEYDKAALSEFKKQKEIVYEIHNAICSYELDETPPIEPDSNAIDLAITIAKLLKMNILDELHINRKQYLDGSIPTGFQRTMILGVDGKINSAGKTINLEMLALEEDSCREINNVGKTITWRVDRLGIPLVEIATKALLINNPEEIKDIAEAIGRVLRATGKVKRGLGTIRQDLNISIKNGARVEIKGVQILDMLPEYVKLEVERQLSLLDIKKELEKRKLKPEHFTNDYLDCKKIFQKTKCKFLAEAIQKKEDIIGIKLQGMKGLLGKKIQAERSYGKEIADRVKIIAGLGGIIHTDELPNYGITEEEVGNLKIFFDCQEDDAVAFVIGKIEDAIIAINEIVSRIRESFAGVPEETRHAHDDGTTSFRRYLGGAGRMYPDTDSYPIIITAERVKKIQENLPELPEKKEERYLKDYNLPIEIAKNLAISYNAPLFDDLVKMGVEPILAAITLEQILKALQRNSIPIENLTEDKIKEIFEYLLEKKIAKEAIEPLLNYFSKNPKEKMEKALIKLNLEVLSEEKLREIIQNAIKQNIDFIKENEQLALGKLMGRVMEQVRGKVDGKIVNQLVNQLFNEKIKDLKESN